MIKDKSIHNTKYKALIKALTEERIRLNISQAELANRIGLNQSDVSKIELFERRLDVLEFALVLDAFRVYENKNLAEIVTTFLNLAKS